MSTQRLVRFRTASGIYPVLPALPPNLAFTQGNIYFVRPYNGRDENDGKSPDKAFKTLKHAHDMMTADQNDICFLMSESNTASGTTDYQSATLTWSKDLCHLIGIVSGSKLSPRARIAFASTYNTASNLFTLSADGCYIANIQFAEGVAGTSPTGNVKVTGQRNVFENCHFAIVNTANDIAGSYELYLNGADECVFKNCVIGNTAALRGAVSGAYQINVDSSAERNIFENCLIQGSFSSATNCTMLNIAAGSSINDYILFKDCMFLNCIQRGGTTSLTYAFSVAAANGGSCILQGACGLYGAADWNNDSSNVIAVGMGTVTAASYGLGAAVTK